MIRRFSDAARGWWPARPHRLGATSFARIMAPARVERHGNLVALYLSGTAYEMGYQHGTLARDLIHGFRRDAYAYVDPQIPGPPWLAFTRFQALCRFVRSITRAMRSSCKDGFVGPRRQSASLVRFNTSCEQLTAPPWFFAFGPSAPTPSGCPDLLWPLLTSARSRPGLLRDVLPGLR